MTLSVLSSEQLALTPKVRDYWINLTLHSGISVEKKDIEGYINKLYRSIGGERPNIVILDSYTATKIAIGMATKCEGSLGQIETQVTEQVKSQIKSQVALQVRSQVWSKIEKQIETKVTLRAMSQVGSRVMSRVGSEVGSKVWSELWSEIWSRVSSEVGSQVWTQVGSPVRSQVMSQVMSQGLIFVEQIEGLNEWAAWLAFYDYFEQIGLINYKPFDEWRDYLRAGLWSVDYFENYVFVSRLPTKVLKDDRGRLHSTTEAAVQWRDGLDNHFIRGVGFDKELWEQVVKKTLPAKDAIALKNIEQRTIACQTIGYDTVVAELNAKVIDKMVRPTPAGKPLHYALLEIDLDDDGSNPARFIKVECPSTGRESLLRVHPEVKTCYEAVPRTFGFRDPQQYWKLAAET